MKNIQEIIQTLDFSGSEKSWFDLWHYHTPKSQILHKLNWQTKKNNIDALITVYNALSKELINFSKPFQLWIEINESLEVQYDSVYIHSSNPNKDNFPIIIQHQDAIEYENKVLHDFISNSNFQYRNSYVVDWETKVKNVQYFLFRKDIGVKLG